MLTIKAASFQFLRLDRNIYMKGLNNKKSIPTKNEVKNEESNKMIQFLSRYSTSVI